MYAEAVGAQGQLAAVAGGLIGWIVEAGLFGVIGMILGAIATILRLPPALNPQRPAAGPRGSSNT